MNHTSSETPRWVVLTGEQRDHLEQDVTVRGRRGAVLVEGPVDHVSEHGEVTIGHGRDGVVVTGPVEVRERDVPQLEDEEPVHADPMLLLCGDRVGAWTVSAIERDFKPGSASVVVTYVNPPPEPDPQRLLDAVVRILDDTPACDVHPDGDAITCGWKFTVVLIREALRGETR